MPESTAAIVRSNAAQPAPLANFTGSSRDVARIGATLASAAKDCHLVSPATSVGQLPEGCSVSLSKVLVDVEHETYSVAGGGDGGDDGNSKGGDAKSKGGKLGLSKTALDRIAAAAGVSWDPDRSRRLDDGRDPNYCSFLAVGSYRHFDGREVVVMGQKEMDLRDKSPQVEALWSRYKAKLQRWERNGKQGWAPKPPDGQIREMRLHICSHAESKARLRAIRALGIRTSYTREELTKPFVIAKIAFTGETNDPALRQQFALMTATAMLAGARALYGDTAPRRLPAPAPVVSAPPLREELEDDDIAPEPEPAEAEQVSRASTSSASPAAAGPTELPRGRDTAPAAFRSEQPDEPPPADDSHAAEREPSGSVIPGGRHKGQAIEDADDRDLAYWADRIEGDLEAGRTKPSFRERDEKLVAAIRREQAWRAGEDEEPGGDDALRDERGSGGSDDDIPF